MGHRLQRRALASQGGGDVVDLRAVATRGLCGRMLSGTAGWTGRVLR